MPRYAAERVRSGIEQALRRALETAAAAGQLPAAVAREAQPRLEVPRERAHGDYATNLALTLARAAGQPPRALAELLRGHLDLAGTYVERVEVAGPGFLNFHLRRDWLAEVLADVLAYGDRYGHSDVGAGRRVLIEFVSANPVGPLNVVNARHAALGDSLARVMEAAGFRVHREYYLNDAGNQVRMLGLAMETRLRQLLGEPAELPEGAYPGEYVIDLARRWLERHGADVLDRPADERIGILARFAVEEIIPEHRQTLRRYRVEYDRWFRESELRAQGVPARVVERLRTRGYTYEADGAIWLRSTAFGDDKDRVLVKRDGEFTYIVPDIAYHLDKFERGYDVVIDLLGRDHFGYHVRMGAALAALGLDPKALEVIYLQMVHLVRDGQTVRMSKRRGDYVTMAEFLAEVSVDAARYFFLTRSADSEIDFDLDLAQLQTQDNPVYYVQYAHARIAGILRQASEQGVAVPASADGLDIGLLSDESEDELLRLIAALPEEVASAALAREPHRLTHFAHALATAFHRFYTRCHVLSEPSPLREARLLLVHAAGVALRQVLGLLGVEAPERM